MTVARAGERFAMAGARFRGKVTAMRRDLDARGIRPGVAAPMLYRLLWRMGLSVRPPLFQPFSRVFALHAAFHGMAWGALMWALLWRRTVDGPANWAAAVAGALAYGTVVGYLSARSVRRRATALSLPPWADYEPPVS